MDLSLTIHEAMQHSHAAPTFIRFVNQFNSKLWVLRRLSKFSIDTSQIFDVYSKEVRSLLKYAVPVWHSGLTRQQTNQIEKIQKTAFRILLGDNYISYDVACTLLGVEPLDLRRRQLCLNFSKKDLKKDNTIFKKCPVMPQTRRVPKLVQEFLCRTHRYENSSLPYLSKLLNKQA